MNKIEKTKVKSDNDIKVLEEISKVVLSIKSKPDSLIVMYDKDSNRKNKYKAYRFNGNGKSEQKLVQNCLDELSDRLKNKSIEKYDLEISTDDTVQKIDASLVSEYQAISEFITLDSKKTPILDKDTEINKFNFYAIKVGNKQNENKSITIFRRYKQNTSHFKKSFKFYFDSKELKELNTDIITIDTTADAFEYEGSLYTLDRNAFNSIFSFKDMFEKIIESKKSEFKNCNILLNFDTFINDCKEDGRYTKRLAKFLIAGDYDKIIEHKNRLKLVAKDFKLSVKVNKKNEIIYDDKNQLNEILNILLQHYVISALTEEKMLAKAIEEYKVR